MPEISLFFGIRVTMFYSDHNPPHFHAEYAGHKALVDIQGAYVIRGVLPARQLKLIWLGVNSTGMNLCRTGSFKRRQAFEPYCPAGLKGAFLWT